MTRRARRFSWGILATTLLAAVAISVFAVQGRSAGAAAGTAHEIVLEARGVAFGENNPTLTVRRGQHVRLVVRNTEAGVVHSIGVPELGAPAVQVRAGEEAVIEFTADRTGTFDYVCPRHLPLMQGKIVVVD